VGSDEECGMIIEIRFHAHLKLLNEVKARQADAK